MCPAHLDEDLIALSDAELLTWWSCLSIKERDALVEEYSEIVDDIREALRTSEHLRVWPSLKFSL